MGNSKGVEEWHGIILQVVLIWLEGDMRHEEWQKVMLKK